MVASEAHRSSTAEGADRLPDGTTLLRGSYRLTGFIASGGFGKTYLAIDNLDRTVVIKECFPEAVCGRRGNEVVALSRASEAEFLALVELFKTEARNLSRVDHPNIIKVHQVFDDNNTAYMALDYVEGRDLAGVIADGHALAPSVIQTMAKKLVNAVGAIHAEGVLHRDISPDNILLTKANEPVLIDFGAARQLAVATSRKLSALRMVKDGYSPQEFYVDGEAVDFSSDLYSLAATLHHVIVGYPPPTAPERVAAVGMGEDDPYTPIALTARGYDRGLLEAIDRALALFPIERMQSAKEWKQLAMGLRIPNRANRARQDATRDLVKQVVEAGQPETASEMPEFDDPLKELRNSPYHQAPRNIAKAVLAASAALVVLSLGGGTLFFAHGPETASTALSRGVATATQIPADLTLADGTALKEIAEDGTSVLRVSAGGAEAQLQSGDVLVALLPRGQAIKTADALLAEIESARARNLASLNVAVRRGEAVVVVPLDISSPPILTP